MARTTVSLLYSVNFLALGVMRTVKTSREAAVSRAQSIPTVAISPNNEFSVECERGEREDLLSPQNLTRLHFRDAALHCQSKQCLERDIVECQVRGWTVPEKRLVQCNSSFIPRAYSFLLTGLSCRFEKGCILRDSCSVQYTLERVDVNKERRRRRDAEVSTTSWLIAVLLVILGLGCVIYGLKQK